VAVPGHLAVMVATDTGEPGLCVHVGVGMTSPLDDAHVTVVNVALEGETTAVNSRVWPLTRLPVAPVRAIFETQRGRILTETQSTRGGLKSRGPETAQM
jgi:hypothetical protein